MMRSFHWNLVPLFGLFDYGSSQSTSMPWLLLAGQSNSIGYPHEAGQRYSDRNSGEPGQSLETLVRIINSIGTLDVGGENPQPSLTRDDLIAECQKVDILVDDTIAAREADALLTIDSNEEGIFSSMLNPLNGASCTWDLPKDYADTGVLKTAARVGPNAGCGEPFGNELMMAHILREDLFNNVEFGMAKVGTGGTTLAQWSNRTDIHWKALVARLNNLQSIHPNCSNGDCPIEAFVWFQGSQDTFQQGDPANYESNLGFFVNNVREEIFRVNPAGTHAGASDIPVVIMGIGCWRSVTTEGQQVVAAQKAFCASDANCEFVQTDDLMCFYHYDAASHLIMGERAANAVGNLLSGDSGTESPPQTTSVGPLIMSFTLVDSDTNEDIVTLVDGATIVLDETPNINIRANTVGTVRSVVFRLRGTIQKIERSAPYSLAGDNGGDYRTWSPGLGIHTLSATAIGERRFVDRNSLSVTFTVVQD